MPRRWLLPALLAAVALGCGGNDARPAGTPSAGRSGGTATPEGGAAATQAPGGRTDGARGAAGVPARLWPEPEGYELDLAYDDRRAVLSGTARIALANTGPRALNSVWLRLWPNAYGSCERPRATVRVTGGGRAGARRARCTAQEVLLDRPLAPGARTMLELAVRVSVPGRPDRFGRFRGAAYLGNALPVLAVADARGWRLPPYASGGESFFSLSAEWNVRLRVRRGLAVASTGSAAGDAAGELLELRAPRARDFAMVIGPLRVTERRAGTVRLRHFGITGDPVADARRALASAAAAIERFERWYGPYDREELDLVQGPRLLAGSGVAMEYAELVLTPPSLGAVTHEVAHQWWFGIVGNDQYREPWLDESFAEFSQARLPRSVGGADRLAGCRAPRRPPPLTASMRVWSRTRGYGRVVYVGGACMLRRLEAALGPDRFWPMLRRIVRSHRDGVWTRADFVGAVREAAADGFEADAFLRREGIL